MSPVVHIIYVRGTVDLLAPFLGTLLHRTTWSFRLVLNGCDDAEKRTLERYGRDFADRIELITIAKGNVLPHGEVLDMLLDAESSEYFCILDSDILAKGSPDLTQLLPAADEAARCSCLPMWHSTNDRELPVGSHIVAGRFLRAADGTFLGCTYAAAYRTEVLRRTLREWNLSLRAYKWDELSGEIQDELRRRGFEHRLFDTAKVANILMQTPDQPMMYVDIPELVHLGAQSGRAAQTPGLRRSLRQLALVRAPWLIAIRLRMAGMTREERQSVLALARRRSHASRLLASLQDGDVSYADAPEWIGSEENFAALQEVLRPRVLEDLP